MRQKWLVSSLAIAVAAVAASAAPAHATSYLVTNTNDAGAGSLRKAILRANQQPDADLIKFVIPGAGPHTLTPASNLPAIAQPLTIDGYTQPGAVEAVGTNHAVPQVVVDASAATIGLEVATDDSVVRGLVIQNAGGLFVGDGIRVWGDRNRIEGNFVGIGADGSADGSGNDGDGVQISGDDNVVGGTDLEDRNVISDNFDAGVRIAFTSDTGNVIENNYIGTDATGTQRAGNSDGVAIAGEDNVVGGTTTQARNVIADNFVGVHLTGDANLVHGNTIGTDVTRTVEVANFDGVLVESDDNEIGGSAAGEGNLISGNDGRGVAVNLGTGNRIEGNVIGPDGNGAAFDDDQTGVELVSSGTSVGGAAEGAGNVISGNFAGIDLKGDDNTVLGNEIGTDAAGEAALPNRYSGITVGGNRNRIGGTGDSEANVLSGNGADGIEIRPSDPAAPDIPWGNVVMGNRIGTTADGLTALPNAYDGVELTDANLNQIGGVHEDEGNTIAGNAGHGVAIDTLETGMADGNLIVGNAIGTDESGTVDLGNGDSGVSIDDGNGNRIGSTESGAGNSIAFNGADGVTVDPGVNDSILRNSIFDNGDLGIDLDDDGQTPNDDAALDADTGSNDLQNHPLINAASQSPPVDGSTAVYLTVNWSLISQASTDYRIEFFSSPRCGDPDSGQARTFLGVREVTTDAAGVAGALATVLKAPQKGMEITATATDIDSGFPEETSEISPCTRAT
jgi:hypothetical protein